MFLFSHPVVRLCQRELVMAIGGFSNWSDSCFSLLRRCYGLERVFEDVHCEADWVDSETSKMKPWLLERYDATSLLGRALRIPAVEKTVLRETRRRSQFDKCLERLRASAAQ